jgi:hypothetical protein
VYDLIGPIAIEGEGSNHFLLSGVHLRQHGSREEFLAALRCRIEHGYFLNIRELLHHCEHADTDARRDGDPGDGSVIPPVCVVVYGFLAKVFWSGRETDSG